MATIVARFPSRHEAEFALELLRDAAIRASVFVDDAGGTHPNLAITTDARLAVHPDDTERARRMLEDAGLLDR